MLLLPAQGVWGAITTCTGGLLVVWGAIITCTGGVGCYNYLHRGCGVLSLPAQGMWGAIITCTGSVGCYNYLHRGCGVL